MGGGGYAWWYVDALSDDGAHGLTLIGFIGSVFSPYYAARRRVDPQADPTDHCALNVALYARPGSGGPRRWAMTERGRGALARDATSLAIGPSALQWRADALQIELDERTMPWAGRLRGTVRVHPLAIAGGSHALDAAGAHQWRPIAPCARVEVDLTHPALHWRGSAYLDSNLGDAPLERDFESWDWSRATLARRRSAVLYDVRRRDGSTLSLALDCDARGRVEPFEPPPRQALPTTGWRIARATRGDPGLTRVQQTLEDTPFYARSLLTMRLHGQTAPAVHESLSLDRFASRWVQALLPFRMPRRA